MESVGSVEVIVGAVAVVGVIDRSGSSVTGGGGNRAKSLGGPVYSIPGTACCVLPERSAPPVRAVEFCVGVGSADNSLGGDEKLFVGLSIAGLVPDKQR